MKIDTGAYHTDPESYKQLVDKLYSEYPSITLSSEYAFFVQENLLRLHIRLARYKFVARLIKKTDRLLEVGCGSGLGSIFLSQHCEHVTGLDVKSTEIEEARSINRRKNIEFKVDDFFNLNNIEQKYDVVVALDVIEHMPVEEGHKLVSAMVCHLKSDGLAVIGSPSIYSYEYQSPLSRASHVKCYDQQELIELMENYFHRILPFSMNDEIVHTGHPKMAWYYFMLAFYPKSDS